jgi:shikimate dehydrogenase
LAVNTIQIQKGNLIGHNTDGRGFIRSLRENAGFNPEEKVVLLVGSGGAARAVGFSLALAGTQKIALYDVDAKKAVALARDIREKTGRDAESVIADSLARIAAASDCLINATPLGLKKNDPLPLKKEFIQKHHLVCDFVYNLLRQHC